VPIEEGLVSRHVYESWESISFKLVDWSAERASALERQLNGLVSRMSARENRWPSFVGLVGKMVQNAIVRELNERCESSFIKLGGRWASMLNTLERQLDSLINMLGIVKRFY